MAIYVNRELIEELEDEEVEPIADDLLLLEMVRAIVQYPEKVKVNVHCDVTTGEAWKILTIHVDPRDIGIIIGRHGRTIDLFKVYISLIGARRGYPISVSIAGTNGHKTTLNRPVVEHIKSKINPV